MPDWVVREAKRGMQWPVRSGEARTPAVEITCPRSSAELRSPTRGYWLDANAIFGSLNALNLQLLPKKGMDQNLRRARLPRRRAGRGARSRPRARRKRDRAWYPVPSRHSQRRHALRLPLGVERKRALLAREDA